MRPINIVCFDCETTGLDKVNDEVLQLSIIDGEGNTLMNQYFKPEHVTEWPNAEAVNHISPEMVKNCPTFREKVPEINQIFKDADLIVSYNGNAFDIPFLENHGVTIPPDKETFDVMLNYAPMHGTWNNKYQNFKWEKLVNCADHYGYQFNAHDSLEDTRATLYCYAYVMPEALTFMKKADDKKARAYDSLEKVMDNVEVSRDVKLACSDFINTVFRDAGWNGDLNQNGYINRYLPEMTESTLIAVGERDVQMAETQKPYEPTKTHSNSNSLR